MKKFANKLVAISVSAVMILSLCSFTALAEGKEASLHNTRSAVGLADDLGLPESSMIEQSSGNNNLSLSTVRNKNINAYPGVGITYNGKNLGRNSLLINGTTYVPLRSFIESITDMTVTYNSQNRTLYVNGYGLELSVTDGAYVIFANGRPLFAMTPSVIMSNGRMYAPVRSVAKALGLTLGWNSSTSTASLSGSVKPLLHANQFYREDEVYWLSRIINAESGGEPLLGQLGVGSVVLNRVASNQYPGTIWGVIFDKKYGVQFSPIINGTIYNQPSSTAVLAAKICLEGFRVSDKALFFLEPTLSTSSWIPNNRTYLFSILHHDFYA